MAVTSYGEVGGSAKFFASGTNGLSWTTLQGELTSFASTLNSKVFISEVVFVDRAGVFPNIVSLTWSGATQTQSFTLFASTTWAANGCSLQMFSYYLLAPVSGTGAQVNGVVMASTDNANVDYWGLTGYAFSRARQVAPVTWNYTVGSGSYLNTFAQTLDNLKTGSAVLMTTRASNNSAGNGMSIYPQTVSTATQNMGGSGSAILAGSPLIWTYYTGWIASMSTDTSLAVTWYWNEAGAPPGTGGFATGRTALFEVQSEDYNDDVPITFYSRTIL